jgi:hypothetical protein
MRILASSLGKFVEPVGEVGVSDFVGFLQLHAATGSEGHVLQSLYRILREGGTFVVIPDASGGTQISWKFAKKEEPKPAKLSSRTEGIETPVTPDPLPKLVQDPAHRHLHSETPIDDPAGVWLACVCGDWKYFERLADPHDPKPEPALPC